MGEGINYKCKLEWASDGGQTEPEWEEAEGGVPAPVAETTATATLPAGVAGTLTTRTGNDEGIATMSSGHGIESDDIVDVYWTGGVRFGMTASVSGTAVSLDGGDGDALPTQSTGLVLDVQENAAFEVTGDDVTSLTISSTKRGAISFLDGDSAVLLSIELSAGIDYEWTSSDPYHENPLDGMSVASVSFSNGNSSEQSIMSVVAS